MTKRMDGEVFTETHVSRGADHFGFDVFVVRKTVGGKTVLLSSEGEWEEMVTGSYGRKPTHSIYDPEQLMKGMRDAGIKIPGESTPVDIIAAKDAHLEDMRKLVFERRISRKAPA